MKYTNAFITNELNATSSSKMPHIGRFDRLSDHRNAVAEPAEATS